MKTQQHQPTKRAGFSLAELMVVIVIIGLLATLVVPNVLQRLSTSQTGIAKTDIVSISRAIDEFAVQNGGRFPESLESLVERDEKGYSYLKGERVPLDPWKNEYQYEPPSGGAQDYRLYSFGKDGEPGGEGDDADITLQAIQNKEI